MRARNLVFTAVALCALTLPALSAANEAKTIKVAGSDGADVGTATFHEVKGGALQISVALHGLPPGVHGIHVHENASCAAPDFKSAGAHFDPIAHQHTNVTVGEDGTASYKYELAALSIGTGQPNDILLHGASIIVHANADDMKTDPTG